MTYEAKKSINCVFKVSFEKLGLEAKKIYSCSKTTGLLHPLSVNCLQTVTTHLVAPKNSMKLSFFEHKAGRFREGSDRC
jgi:hypothetical protein